MEFIASSRRLLKISYFRGTYLQIFEDKRLPIYWSKITDFWENWSYESGPHSSPDIAQFSSELQVLKNRMQSQREPGAILCCHSQVVLYQNLRAFKLFGSQDHRFQLCEAFVVDKQVNQDFFSTLKSYLHLSQEIEFFRLSNDNTLTTFTKLVNALYVTDTRYPVILTKLTD